MNESHGAEHNQGDYALTASYVQLLFTWLLVQSAWFVYVYANPF
jgi:hypothetical protein